MLAGNFDTAQSEAVGGEIFADMAPGEDLNLPDKTEKNISNDEAVVDTQPENEATHEELPSSPEVTELLTEPELEKAEDTPTIQIIDILTDPERKKFIASGAEVKVDNDEFTRDSTFMTELEDTNEIQQDNIDEQGKLDKLEQLCDESAILKEEMEESKSVVEDKLVGNTISIEQASFVEKIAIIDDENVETVNIIDDENDQPEDIPTCTKDSEDNKIVEAMSEKVLALPVQQSERTELRNPIKEEKPSAVPDIIARKSSDNISAENAKDTENVSIIVLVLAAYVVYQIMQLKLCQLFSLVG